MTDNWIPYKEVDWFSEEIKQVHIDTRDFHALVRNEPNEKTPDLEKVIQLKERFFFNPDDIKALIERYHTDSGGERKWRFFCLEKHKHWFKYIRILKTEHGWLVCDNYLEKAISKDVLSSAVINDDYDKP